MDEGRSLPVMVTSFLIHLRQLTPPNLDEMLLLDGPLIHCSFSTLCTLPSPLVFSVELTIGTLHCLWDGWIDGWMGGQRDRWSPYVWSCHLLLAPERCHLAYELKVFASLLGSCSRPFTESPVSILSCGLLPLLSTLCSASSMSGW